MTPRSTRARSSTSPSSWRGRTGTYASASSRVSARGRSPTACTPRRTACPTSSPAPILSRASARSALVIGAGFAGLAAADALAERGVEVTVLEALDRVGGRVWSQPLADGSVVERGAEFVLPGYEVLSSFVRRLGLELYEKGTLYGERDPV